MKKILIISALVLVLVFMASYKKREPSIYDAFAECLAEKGARMYGTEWCPHCKDQKEVFDGAFDKIDYIDCDLKSLQCKEAGVTGYPTWILADGEKLIGTQDLETLADKTSCELPQ